MWVRGMLADDYGIEAADINWRQGGLDVPGRTEKFRLNVPPGFPVAPLAARTPLSSQLAEGHLDAVFGPRPPACFADGKTPVKRLYEDYEAAELAYFQRTRVFPIMHALGIRN